MRKGEPPVVRVARVSCPVADAIAGLTGPDVHVALFGHGLGALQAFEAARHLEVRRRGCSEMLQMHARVAHLTRAHRSICPQGCHGRAPIHLFVSGCASPDTWPSNESPDKKYTPWSIEKDSARSLGLKPSVSPAVDQGLRRGPRARRNPTSGLQGTINSHDGGQDDGDEDDAEVNPLDGKDEDEHICYAYEQTEEKLVGLLSLCARTPRHLAHDKLALQVRNGLLR